MYVMGEILNNIKLIKMNCWEELFMNKVVGMYSFIIVNVSVFRHS